MPIDETELYRKLNYVQARWQAISEMMSQIQREREEILKVIEECISMSSGKKPPQLAMSSQPKSTKGGSRQIG